MDEAQSSCFNRVRGVWILGKTLLGVFNRAPQTINNYRRIQSKRSSNFMVISIIFKLPSYRLPLFSLHEREILYLL